MHAALHKKPVGQKNAQVHLTVHKKRFDSGVVISTQLTAGGYREDDHLHTAETIFAGMARDLLQVRSGRRLIHCSKCEGRFEKIIAIICGGALRVNLRTYFLITALCGILCALSASPLSAAGASFHDAPASSAQVKNPYAGKHAAVLAGSRLYATNCSSCHGTKGQGNATNPALAQGATQSASDGELFWFITTGAPQTGMPSWASLSEQKRWQIVTYLKSL